MKKKSHQCDEEEANQIFAILVKMPKLMKISLRFAK